MQKIADVRGAIALLNWDQETYLPRKGAALRSRQLTSLNILAHQLATDPELDNILQILAEKNELDPLQKKNAALSLKDLIKAKKYPAVFVEKLSQTTAASYHAWIEARRKNDYVLFEPMLSKMVELKKEEAGLLGYTGHPYNALLDEFEKGVTTGLLDDLFSRVREQLGPLLSQIASRNKPETGFLRLKYPRDRQWQFGIGLLKEMGFDFEAGRQDLSEHPFTTSLGNQDVRITTRIDENDLASMTWSCLHEGGHALYEQGLPGEAYGLPRGEAASTGIHESQSRFWENMVGRSRTYWEHHYPELQTFFPENLSHIPLNSFYQAINRVTPSLIRTEADELTYHFHIMIRYELEKELIGGQVSTAGLKDLWNERYATVLGLKVPDDLRGILQDIHWSHGSFGYFPTYSLGSFLAAQLYSAAERDIPDFREKIRRGELSGIVSWLKINIHSRGRLYTLPELCRMVTGEELDFRYFMEYASAKYASLYGIEKDSG